MLKTLVLMPPASRIGLEVDDHGGRVLRVVQRGGLEQAARTLDAAGEPRLIVEVERIARGCRTATKVLHVRKGDVVQRTRVNARDGPVVGPDAADQGVGAGHRGRTPA